MIERILENHDIVPSQFRMKVLNVLMNSNRPIFQHDIERELDLEHDRVTMYRTLKLFVKNQLVHRIPVSDNLVVYRYINSEYNNEKEHLHFHCKVCNQVFCMPHITFQEIDLPEGYKKENINLVVNGLCKKCNDKYE